MQRGRHGGPSAAELDLVRARLRGGLENKARRGESRLSLPVGLDRDEDGQFQLSSDEQVRAAIRRVRRRAGITLPPILAARCLGPIGGGTDEIMQEILGHSLGLGVGYAREQWTPRAGSC